MSLRGRQIIAAIAVAAVALAADQLTKVLARARISPGESIELPLGIELVRVRNEGIAFGLFDDAGWLVLAIAALAFAALLAWFLVSISRPGMWLPVGLLGGGALGNLVDRARHGAVTDFIDLPSWPAFNLADVEITLGVVLLLIAYLRPEPDAQADEGAEAGERRERSAAEP